MSETTIKQKLLRLAVAITRDFPQSMTGPFCTLFGKKL